MSAWGKYDRRSGTGTITISFNGTVTGTNTEFTTELLTGDFIKTDDGNEYIVIAVDDDTSATVINANPESGDLVEQTDSDFDINEKPTSLASDPNTLSSEVFGVNRYEIHGDQAGGYVSAVGIIQGGTGYTEVPAVTFQNGGGSGAAATATIADGVVTAITVTNNGSSYETAPDIFINIPYRTIATSAVNTTSEVITYNNHGIAAGDQIRYYSNGGSAIGGLTNATTYYAGEVTTNGFKVYDTSAHAIAGGATGRLNLTTTGNNGQYFDLLDETTATANAAFGVNQGVDNADSGAVSHTGWVKRKVLEGQHAGRIQYEVLVALSKNGIAGDAADDIEFPED